MNERIKLLRTTLGLSGEKFGERIGLSKYAISNIEMGKNNLTEQTIISICREYNVDEEWLRTGKGEMFSETQDDYLKRIEKQYNLEEIDLKIIRAYLKINADERKAFRKYIKSITAED